MAITDEMKRHLSRIRAIWTCRDQFGSDWYSTLDNFLSIYNANWKQYDKNYKEITLEMLK